MLTELCPDRQQLRDFVAGRLPERWWLSPTSHHDLIPAGDRRFVLVWGTIGGSGFLVIVLGIVVITVGLWRMLSG